jgi:type II secretory pathway pseudopilin PulG
MQPAPALVSTPMAEPAVSWVAGAASAALVTLLLAVPFLIPRRTRRWAAIAFGVCILIELVPLSDPSVAAFYWSVGEVTLGVLVFLLASAALVAPLLLWRRTRRLGLVLVGASLLSALLLANYWAQVICTIGYILLLLALWPRWRLLQAAPRGRELPPVIPSRGVLRVRSWPACRRTETEGFSLITSLIGIGFVIIAAAVATQAISTTMAAVRRADHLAVATDLLESARERSRLGGDAAGLQAQAARLLPKGTATLARRRVRPGLMRVSALATWEEANGTPGRATLEWLTAEGSQ